MMLLTQANRKALPPLYSQDGKGYEAVAVVKFFTPDSSWTWYATEGSEVDADGLYDTDAPKVDYLMFGLVDGLEPELGYFALSELASARGPLGLPIERDRYFKPCPLSEVRQA
jgi:hypothetical protein